MDEGKLVRVFRDASRWKDDETEREMAEYDTWRGGTRSEVCGVFAAQ